MKTIALLFIISLFINCVFGDEVSLMEGDSVTLHTNDADIQKPDATVIWKFGAQKTRIARINRAAANKAPIYDADVINGRFKDRLKMNDQTGDLTITNITTIDSGLYEVQILIGIKNILKSFDVKGVSNPESDQLKSVSVKDADSVTLLADVPDIKKYDEILWRFRGVPIAEFNKSASEISEDKRFRDKLQLDVQTGSLQIRNIRMDLSGLYEVEITSSTSSSYTIHQSFTVTVSGEVKSVSAMKSYPVTIKTDVPDIKTYDQILLIFGCDEKRIAEVNKQNKQFMLNERFRDRLKLNDQTGDLTITDIRNEDAGDYELKMSSRRRSIQRRFRVNVSEPGLSSGAIAGICVFIILLAAAAAAAVVIYYRRKIAELQEKRDVYAGESVHLKTEVKDIKRDDLIEWRFGDEETLIAAINPANNIFNTYDGDGGLFRDKLNLNTQTGDLTIKDSRQEHAGVYTLKIIRDGETTERILSVSVRYKTEELQVSEGASSDLKTDLKDIKRDDLIEWKFGDDETLIAEINPANNIFSTYDGVDGEFRDKLKLNVQTGDLNINDITWKHDGVYTLKIIRDEKNSYKRFTVCVSFPSLYVYERKSVHLKTKVKDTKSVDVIEWRFRETLIAKINPVNKIFSTYDGLDFEFKDKLKLNHQTGDLNINDINEEHEGDYNLKIIRGGEISDKRFSVFVRYNVEERKVNEGKSVDLKTDLKDIQGDDLILWRFGHKETPIAEIYPAYNIFSTYGGDYDLFKDKLKLNNKTGDLNIKDFTWKHSGDYILKIIRDGKISKRRFKVSVGGERQELKVNEGESVDLKTEVTHIKRIDLISWRFDETLIAEINPAKNIYRTYDDDYDLFKDKLKLNPPTGDLNINDIKEEHTGEYKLFIIRDGETSSKSFILSLYADAGKVKPVSVNEKESVTLKTEASKQEDPVENRGGDSVGIEMPLLNNSSQ